MSKAFDSSRRFYDAYVAEMIKDKFSQYEDRIAVGIAGEGSDCFGYDDFMSRDHDFGTGVCLWLDDDDMKEFGNELSESHKFSAALQVNYARCMTRDDVVAARLCQMQGLEAAMELFFLMNRCFAPYYKWTYRRLCELDIEGRCASLIRELSDAPCDRAAWKGKRYSANYINMGDTVIVIAEQLAKAVVRMMKEHNLIGRDDPYLELYVNEVLN